jgi:hypothetical protein
MKQAIRVLILAATCVIGLAACTATNPGTVGTQRAQTNPFDNGGGGGGGGSGY